MIDIPSMRPETRYGLPSACDQLLFNRHYIVGYSNLLRQPRFAMELVTTETLRDEVERKDVFRADPRIDEDFVATLSDYKGSGYHRGHLVCSQDRIRSRLENSETFLLSNMSPQLPELNSGAWAQLEAYIRDVAKEPDVLEVYVACGPIFDLWKPIDAIGGRIPIPHAFWKSFLTVSATGRLQQWSFRLSNLAEDAPQPWSACQVPTSSIEQATGLPLWDRINTLLFLSDKRSVHKLPL